MSQEHSKDETTQIKRERELLFYGFTIDEFTLQLKEIYGEALGDAVAEFGRMIMMKVGDTPERRKAFTDLYNNLAKDAEESLELLGETAVTLFAIPEDLVVPGYDDIKPFDSLKKLEQEVAGLERKFVENKVYLELLEESKRKIDAVSKWSEVLKKEVEEIEGGLGIIKGQRQLEDIIFELEK